MRNVADERQIRDHEAKLKQELEQEIVDLRAVISEPEGKRVIKRLVKLCSPVKSIWHASALIHYRSGAQDVGHHIIKLICQADPEFASQMVLEIYNESTGVSE